MVGVGEFEQFDGRAVFDYERDADAVGWAVRRNQDFAASKLGGEISHFKREGGGLTGTATRPGDRVTTLPFTCVCCGHQHWVPEWAVPPFRGTDGTNVFIEDRQPVLDCTEKLGEKAQYYWLNEYRPVKPGQEAAGEKAE